MAMEAKKSLKENVFFFRCLTTNVFPRWNFKKVITPSSIFFFSEKLVKLPFFEESIVLREVVRLKNSQ